MVITLNLLFCDKKINRENNFKNNLKRTRKTKKKTLYIEIFFLLRRIEGKSTHCLQEFMDFHAWQQCVYKAKKENKDFIRQYGLFVY